ncbi:MAG: hypothetical protein V1694_02335 [Candidatus Eisenbacteria bacterium]
MRWLSISWLVLCAVTAILIITPAATLAGGNSGHKIAVHVLPHGGHSCKSLPTFTECDSIVTTYPDSGDVDVFPVFYGLTEYTAVEFALSWPAEWGTCSYATCTQTLNIGSIANPGDGIASAWTTCQTGWSVVPGFGWLYATGPGMVSIVPNPATDDYGTVDCASSPGPYHDPPDSVYSAGVGGMEGDDPCAEPDRGEQEGAGESGGIRGYYR